MIRKAYPGDVTDEEWAFVAPYLTLMSEDAPQREHWLREVFNGLRYLVRSGAPWRWKRRCNSLLIPKLPGKVCPGDPATDLHST